MLIFILLLVLAGIFYLFGKKELSSKLQKMALWWIPIAFAITAIFVIIGAVVGE